MYRLLTWHCPHCRNPFHVELAVADHPAPAHRCYCPRCHHELPAPGGDVGVVHEESTPWALRATPAE